MLRVTTILIHHYTYFANWNLHTIFFAGADIRATVAWSEALFLLLSIICSVKSRPDLNDSCTLGYVSVTKGARSLAPSGFLKF